MTMNKITRYGPPPIFHPLHILNIIMLCVCIGVFDFSKVTSYIFIAIYFFFLYRQISPFFEYFCINEDVIYSKLMNHSDEKTIPSEAVFIISYTDLGGFSYSFKNRFMVNIVTEDLDNIYRILHSDKCRELCDPIRYGYGLCLHEEITLYNNLYIESQFEKKWIYSFVYKRDFTNKFFNEQKKPVIVPRSLADKIQIEPNGFEVIIDEER